LPAVHLLRDWLVSHPVARTVWDAFQTAGRGGSHRLVDPAGGRLRRVGLTLVLLAMLATGPVPGTHPAVVALDPFGEPAGERMIELLAPSRSADRSGAADLAAAEDSDGEVGEGQDPERQDGEPGDSDDSGEDPDSDSGEEPSSEQESESEPEPEKEPEPEPEADEPDEPEIPEPVGGLNQRQMEHAAVIVRVGQEMGLPKYAYVIAIATALQESYLRVLASDRIPKSFNYDHDGSGNDHDSVGLFQQRPSMGWGTVKQCMDPEYSARVFYEALKRVPGWRGMPVTVAAQAVQKSAYPNHYAKHEPLAREIVNALI